MILNVFTKQGELLNAICHLHTKGIDLDVTYGMGGIYRGSKYYPARIMDLNPDCRIPMLEKADCRELPFADNSIHSIMFDPPFLAGGGTKGKMRARYHDFRTVPAMYRFYGEAIKEFHRVLRPGGHLVFKCQDILNGRTQGWSHCEVYRRAVFEGFYALDLFVLVTKNRMRPHNMREQQHARKASCYFWVFKKCNQKNHI